MFWNLLDPADQKTLVEAGTQLAYPERCILFNEGDPSSSVLVLRRGQVKLTVVSIDGTQTMHGLLGPGEILGGQTAALAGQNRLTTATTLTASSAVVTPMPTFQRLLATEPGFALALLRDTCRRIEYSARNRQLTDCSTVSERLARRLLELAHSALRENGVDIDVGPTLSQQELAEWVGASRHAVVLALGEMRQQGWIETGRRRLRILDPVALALEARSAG